MFNSRSWKRSWEAGHQCRWQERGLAGDCHCSVHVDSSSKGSFPWTWSKFRSWGGALLESVGLRAVFLSKSMSWNTVSSRCAWGQPGVWTVGIRQLGYPCKYRGLVLFAEVGGVCRHPPERLGEKQSCQAVGGQGVGWRWGWQWQRKQKELWVNRKEIKMLD